MCNIDVNYIELIIGAIIGYCLSLVASAHYEKRTAKRKADNQRNMFRYLNSKPNTFDYESWKIENGKVTTSDNAFTELIYSSENVLTFKWISTTDESNKGKGIIMMNDQFRGELFYYFEPHKSFNFRKVYCIPDFEQFGKRYCAIFVNAIDEGRKYVMMKPLS
jgi:hypothetical protein